MLAVMQARARCPVLAVRPASGTAARTRSLASATASPASRMANSSPPIRPIASPGRRFSRSRSASISRAGVAGGVAVGVVDPLEMVEVEQRRGSMAGRRAAGAAHPSPAGGRRARLSRPVSGSVLAARAARPRASSARRGRGSTLNTAVIRPDLSRTARMLDSNHATSPVALVARYSTVKTRSGAPSASTCTAR